MTLRNVWKIAASVELQGGHTDAKKYFNETVKAVSLVLCNFPTRSFICQKQE